MTTLDLLTLNIVSFQTVMYVRKNNYDYEFRLFKNDIDTIVDSGETILGKYNFRLVDSNYIELKLQTHLENL